MALAWTCQKCAECASLHLGGQQDRREIGDGWFAAYSCQMNGSEAPRSHCKIRPLSCTLRDHAVQKNVFISRQLSTLCTAVLACLLLAGVYALNLINLVLQSGHFEISKRKCMIEYSTVSESITSLSDEWDGATQYGTFLFAFQYSTVLYCVLLYGCFQCNLPTQSFRV